MSETGNIPPSARLLDEEAKQEQERREKISRVALLIEETCLREHLTMGDVLEVFELFNGRANRVFSAMPISRIKELYERQNQ